MVAITKVCSRETIVERNGNAKFFWRKISVNSYEELKHELFNEFDVKISSADVHSMLRESSKNQKKRAATIRYEYC